jgi:transposase
MKYFAGLDVSLHETSVCIVDENGRIALETKVMTDGEAVCLTLRPYTDQMQLIGLEAGPLSQHLFSCMVERNDARGIAQMIRVGLFKPVHVKTERSQRLRVLLTVRKLLKGKLLDIEADLRGVLKNFGLKLGKVNVRDFEPRVRELAAFDPMIAEYVDPVLIARLALREQYDRLHRMLLHIVRGDAVCRRLMTMPGVGPVVALTYRVTVDVPARFAKSRNVGAHFGLTPRQYQSGEVDWRGGVSKNGDPLMRATLYEAAQVLLSRVSRWSSLRSWGMRVARKRGRRKAIVALARRMSVILHRMWTDETDFQWGTQPAQ